MLSKYSKKIDRYFAGFAGLLIISYIAIFTYLFFGLPKTSIFNWAFLFLILAFGIDGIKIIVESLAKQKIHQIKTDGKKITVLISTHNSASIIKKTIQQAKLNLPESPIWVIDDASEDNTCAIAKKNGATVQKLPFNHGKVGAIHSIIEKIETPYVLLLDDDTELVNTKIPTNLLKKHDAVAFKVLPFGTSYLSHFQRHEYRKCAEITRKFHSKTGTVPCISGACGLFRKDAILSQIDSHSGEFSGEDLQRTLLIHKLKNGRGIASVNEEVYTHAPEKFMDLYVQRVHGWWPGLWNNLDHFVHLAFGKNTPWRLRYDAIYSLFLIVTDPLRIIALPFLIASPKYFLAFYLFYVLLEAFPYFRMGRQESILVWLLAPIYGIFGLFARVIGFFVWIYRRVTSMGKMKSVPDAYLHAPVHQRIFAFTSGSLFCLILLMLGSFRNAQEIGMEPSFASLVSQPPVIQQAEIEPVRTNKEKIYSFTARLGDGGILIARRAIEDYRNDFGGYDDHYVKFLAEEKMGRAIKADKKSIEPGDSFNFSQSEIQNYLDQAQTEANK